MTLLRSDNGHGGSSGIFATAGELEKAGLAVAFSIDNLKFKVNKTKPESWKTETQGLIKSVHTVLAQYDSNHEKHSLRMLNAGGILTLSSETGQPLAMVMLKEKNGLNLGFGKVELKDISEELVAIQDELDKSLQTILQTVLDESDTKEAFLETLKTMPVQQFAQLQSIIDDKDLVIGNVLSKIQSTKPLPSSFGRPDLNGYATLAVEKAAEREIEEEIVIENISLKGRTHCEKALNRADTTMYVSGIIGNDDPKKFSAKEFNDDIESTTFVVNCTIKKEELSSLTPKNCIIITPMAVEITKDTSKNTLQTVVKTAQEKEGLNVLGGGNQFAVPYYWKEVFGVDAKIVEHKISQVTRDTVFQPSVPSLVSSTADLSSTNTFK